MFLSVRITPENCENADWRWDLDEGDEVSIKSFWHHFSAKWINNAEKYLLAYETTNKFGEPCAPHYHVNIYGELDFKKETLQKWFNKHGAKGNKAYCIQLREDCDDEGRWWRYCCKEKVLLSYGFSAELLAQMVEMATTERAHQVAQNLRTRDRLVQKNQFRDKLFKYLKDHHANVTGTRELIKLIGTYYQDQGKTPPFSKLHDVATDYQVVAKIISWDDWIGERIR